MLKLTVDPIVLQTLKKAMPKTDKADHALSRYVETVSYTHLTLPTNREV